MLTSVSNMGHFGRLTDYAKQLTDKGIISIFLLMEEGQIQLFSQ